MSKGENDLMNLLSEVRGGGNGLRKYDILVETSQISEDKGVIKVAVYRLAEGRREILFRTAFIIPIKPGRPLAIMLSRGFKAAVAVDINKDVLSKVVALFIRELVKEKLLKGLSIIQRIKREGVGGSK